MPSSRNCRRGFWARAVALLGCGRRLLVLTSPLALAGWGGVLDPAGPVAEAQRTITFNALAIMLAIVVPTIGATLAFACWFRASNTRAVYRPQFVYSGRIELIVWSIPTLVIVFLGGVIWIGSHELDPAQPLKTAGTTSGPVAARNEHGSAKPTLDVQVVSLDWKWLFIYPEQGVAAVNQLVMPVGRPVRFSLTSASVWNVFFVPQLGSMIYAMNGMTTRLHLQADRAGEYEGMSAMFSGDGFPSMRFIARAVPDREFDTWVTKAGASERSLDRATYTELSKQSTDVAPVTYRNVQPGLFQAIATQELPAASGPKSGRGGPGLSHRSGG